MNYYDFALKNLKTAELHYNYDGDLDEIVVSCQQYLEKAFKQLLILKDGSVYKTHKITFLVNKLGIADFMMHEDVFRKIQDYYFDKRCPSEVYESTTKEEADYIYKLVVNLKPIIEDYINRYSVRNSKLDNSSIFDDV